MIMMVLPLFCFCFVFLPKKTAEVYMEILLCDNEDDDGVDSLCSHHLSPWYCFDIIIRNSVVIAMRVKGWNV